MEPNDTTSDGPAQPPSTAPADLPAAPAESSATPAELPAAPADLPAAPAESSATPAELPAAPADPSAAPAESPAPPAAPARPRGRTALLIAAAALLGISGGTAVGYGIQAERPPTPLPALSQMDLAYPAKALPADKAPAPLPASQDRRVKTDGDLRKLLLDRPAGWSENNADWLEDGWMTVGDLARDFESEDSMFEYFLESDIRRIAGASWVKGEDREVAIQLVQFSAGASTSARDFANGQRAYMAGPEAGAGNEGDPVKGSGEGRYYLYEVEREPGYEPFYRARALMNRGDVMVEIDLYDSRPISKRDIRTLAEQQLERL
ncbi:hypothetical protein ACIRJR_32115 [Streptomyces sp. NPDC102402]|uniref:hypothetical protein n=1 Tax=Streptomyces sp. NPDC102402 TaxID=3366169 RepID=UPI0037FC0FD4